VAFFKEECVRYTKNKEKTVLLDVSGVSYIDTNGVKMLESIKDENLQIINCPMFIEALLKDLISINRGD
jgi:anti-anti-sigma regulatory factor